MYCNDVITKNLCLIISTLSAVQFHRDKKTQKKQKWGLYWNAVYTSATRPVIIKIPRKTPLMITAYPIKVYLLDTDSNNNSSIFWMYLTSYKKPPNICMYRIHSRTYLCLCLHTVHYRAHAPAFGLCPPTILLPICVCSGHPSKAQPLLHTYYIA